MVVCGHAFEVAVLVAANAGGLVQPGARFRLQQQRQVRCRAAYRWLRRGPIRWAHGLGWNREQLPGGVVNERFDLKTLASGRVGKVRVRSQAVWDITSESGLRTADLSAYWSGGENADWEVGAGYDRIAGRTRARVAHIRRFNGFAVAGTLEAASDRSFAAGINVNFSLDSGSRLVPVRKSLASTGQVRATVFRDDNNNGVHDAGEQAGSGLRMTWPTDKGLPPLVAIDHVLADRRVRVASARRVAIPGSDHDGVLAELVLPDADRGGG